MHCSNIALFLTLSFGIVFSAPALMRLQPELDRIDVPSYLQNERLVRLQFKCLIFDGPCDIVGRWAKPRAKGLLLGTCELCTETQKGWVRDWFDILTEKFPDMYRAAVAKYIQNEGIEIDAEEQKKINEAFREDGVANFFENVKGIEKLAPGNTKSTTTPNENIKLTNVTMAPASSSTISTTLTNNDIETSTLYDVESTDNSDTESPVTESV